MTSLSGETPSCAGDTPRAFPGFGQGLLLVLFVWLGIALAAVIVTLVTSLPAGSLDPPPQAVLLLIANTAAFAVVTVLAWRRTGQRPGAVFPLRPVRAVLLAPILPIALGGVAVLAQLDGLLRLLPAPEWWNGILRMIDETMVAMVRESIWSSAVVLVVMAPLTEEFFFRGLILHGFCRRYPRGKAVVLSALLFAVTHLTPNQLLSAFAIGLFLAWITLETASLWPALATHAVVNATALASIDLGAPSPQAPAPPELLPWWVAAAGLAALAVGGWWLRRLLGAARPAL